MYKYLFAIRCFVCLSSIAFGQDIPPRWLEQSVRDYLYPNNTFFTGFVSEKASDPIQEQTDKLKTEAQKSLSENIRVRIKSESQSTDKSIRMNGNEQINSTYSSEVQSSSNVEIVGIKTESYHDKSANIIYAFACVNKYELIGYYKSNLQVNTGQIESYVKTAQDLEANNEKAQARQQLETAKPIFSKIRYAQDILTALDNSISVEDLQQEKIEAYYNTFTQMQARLAQAIYVYVESNAK